MAGRKLVNYQCMSATTLRALNLLVLLTLAACGSATIPSPPTTPSTTEHQQPRGIDQSFRWITTPEFDPLSSEGTFVRAYVESYELARDGIGTGWGYPGFADASPPDIDMMLKLDQLGLSFTSTRYYRMLSRQSDSISTRITLCRYGESSIRQEDGWEHGAWPPQPVLIAFDTGGSPPPEGERGRFRAPTTDVFGDWKVTEFDLLADDIAGQPTLSQQCDDNLTGLPTLPAEPYPRAEPVPPLPPSPGWPGVGL
ncbi:hypothetical protein [Williamsia sp. 1135]|uniref:hypothetical protein n=1 Tax=Williamsia sp. 1135 TaxID=1889262 RepID=UPI00117E27C9|nr:hypothetical protein [Williamsia sp. 1135]